MYVPYDVAVAAFVRRLCVAQRLNLLLPTLCFETQLLDPLDGELLVGLCICTAEDKAKSSTAELVLYFIKDNGPDLDLR